MTALRASAPVVRAVVTSARVSRMAIPLDVARGRAWGVAPITSAVGRPRMQPRRNFPRPRRRGTKQSRSVEDDGLTAPAAQPRRTRTGPTTKREGPWRRSTRRLLNWASILEDNTREQAERTASMPFIYPHLALMPDAHLGKGATVGSVIPTDGAIIPAAVGVDIGCGMMAVRTQFTAADLAGAPLAVLHGQIERAVPLSAGRYNTKSIRDSAEPRVDELAALPGVGQADGAVRQLAAAARLARLGQPLHRGVARRGRPGVAVPALRLARRGQQARAAAHQGGAGAVPRGGASSCPTGTSPTWWRATPEFDAYIEALRWAQRFAYLNREEMMDRVVDQLRAGSSARRGRARRDNQLPPQLHRAGDALRP